MKWRWRRRGRPPSPVKISFGYEVNQLIPVPVKDPEPIEISKEELEALRLVDLEGLTQEEAGKKMGCSRTKVWRLLESGRKKIIKAIVEGRPIVIS